MRFHPSAPTILLLSSPAPLAASAATAATAAAAGAGRRLPPRGAAAPPPAASADLAAPASASARAAASAAFVSSFARGGAAADAVASASASAEAAAEAAGTGAAGGGVGADAEEDAADLDERVRRAMRKLGLSSPEMDDEEEKEEEDAEGAKEGAKEGGAREGAECGDGVCSLSPSEGNEDPISLADRLSSEMGVPRQVALAAIGAAGMGEGGAVDEGAVRSILRSEVEMVGGVSEDCDEAKRLASEGHDPYLSRRALAFAEMDVDDARAILVADEEDEEEEERRAQAAAAAKEEEEAARAKVRADAEARRAAEAEMRTVRVAADFDPAAPGGGAAAAAAGLPGLTGATGGGGGAAAPRGAPKPARREDVVFEIGAAQIQEIVLESPVPVLLDVYADWCGPCKVLTPALEEMAVKAGGMFRLVKLNSDDERSASQALEVRALPTVFGIRDGRIRHSFQGMPRDEDMLRSFMMGLLGAGPFNPPPTDEESEKHAALSTKLVKVAGASSFPFSARERLQDRTRAKLDELVTARGGNMADAEESAATVRSLLSNVIRDPYEAKFRRVNLENRVIRARVGAFPQCLAILKSVGFVPDRDGGGMKALVLGEGRRAVNVAPLVVARDCIDKWIDRNRHDIAANARKRRDEIERARLAAETAAMRAETDEYDSEEEEEEFDPDACSIKLRLEGKKRVHEIAMRADDPLSALVDSLPVKVEEGEEVRVTCAAKRLIVRSTDEEAMAKTLREHGLAPAAAVVAKVGGGAAAVGSANGGGKSSLAERAAARRNKKKGSHTMQSIGIYSKDDNAKGELIDGGGGVWYEHDVSDDEEADKAGEDGSTQNREHEGEDEGRQEEETGEEDA